MSKKSIDLLHLSVRTSNALHRNGIHYIDELLITPIEEISKQRHIGAKTIEEIKNILKYARTIVECEESEMCDEHSIAPMVTDEQLLGMSQHSIDELGLSKRSYNALLKAGYLTIDKIARISQHDLINITNIGENSVDDIRAYLKTEGNCTISTKYR